MSTQLLHPVTVATTQLDGITDVSFDDGATFDRELTDGNIDPYFIAKSSEVARATYSSLAVSSFLGIVGFGTATGNFVATDAVISDGAKASGSVHNTKTITTARHVLQSLSVSQGENATLTAEAIAYNASGSNQAYTRAVDQALPSFTPGSNERFFLSKVEVNGTEISGVSGWNLAFNTEVSVRPSDGFIVPKAVEVISRVPNLTIQCIDTDAQEHLIAAAGNSGLAIDGSKIVLYLKKRAADGVFVSDITTQHVKIELAAGVVGDLQTSGNPRELTVNVYPRAGSVASVVFDNASAIT